MDAHRRPLSATRPRRPRLGSGSDPRRGLSGRGWRLVAYGVPLAFLAGYIGTVTAKTRGDEEFATEMEVRSMTGAGAGAAIDH